MKNMEFKSEIYKVGDLVTREKYYVDGIEMHNAMYTFLLHGNKGDTFTNDNLIKSLCSEILNLKEDINNLKDTIFRNCNVINK